MILFMQNAKAREKLFRIIYIAGRELNNKQKAKREAAAKGTQCEGGDEQEELILNKKCCFRRKSNKNA